MHDRQSVLKMKKLCFQLHSLDLKFISFVVLVFSCRFKLSMCVNATQNATAGPSTSADINQRSYVYQSVIVNKFSFFEHVDYQVFGKENQDSYKITFGEVFAFKSGINSKPLNGQAFLLSFLSFHLRLIRFVSFDQLITDESQVTFPFDVIDTGSILSKYIKTECQLKISMFALFNLNDTF